MKKIFLTSDMGCSKKINNQRYATPLDNRNGIVEHLKNVLKREKNFVFFVSNPFDYEKSYSYAKLTFESFKMSGFNFTSFIIVDGKYDGNLKEDVLNADLIFLPGGKTLTQMRFFEKINLKELLKSYNGVIIGQSAGSINLAYKVICPPEEEGEIGTNYIWQGLGQTQVNVIPHFKLEVSEGLDKKLRNELLKLSFDNILYAISDGAYIFADGEYKIVYGKSYLINQGHIENICEDGESKRIE